MERRQELHLSPFLTAHGVNIARSPFLRPTEIRGSVRLCLASLELLSTRIYIHGLGGVVFGGVERGRSGLDVGGEVGLWERRV